MISQIEKLSSWASKIASLGLLIMALIVGYEVASRYILNSPTIWAWDINVQLQLLLLMLGLSETFRRDIHVRVDIFTGLLSMRGRAILDILFAPVIFLIAIVLSWTGWEYFYESYSRMQTASTLFAPPLYPIKFALPLGSALLLLEAILKLVRDIKVAVGDISSQEMDTSDER